MSANTITRVRLTAATVGDIATQMVNDPIAGFVTMWRAIEPGWDELDSVRPGDYQLDYATTTTFINAMAEGMDKGSVLLLWLNQGPGTVQPS